MLSPEPSEENAFILKKVEDTTKHDVFFIASTIPILEKFGKAAITTNMKYFEQEYLKEVIRILEKLIFFVLNIDVLDNRDALTADGESIYEIYC